MIPFLLALIVLVAAPAGAELIFLEPSVLGDPNRPHLSPPPATEPAPAPAPEEPSVDVPPARDRNIQNDRLFHHARGQVDEPLTAHTIASIAVSIEQLEDRYGREPALEMLKARFFLRTNELEKAVDAAMLSGTSAEAAIIRIQVGAAVYTQKGDHRLMVAAFEDAAPALPDALTPFASQTFGTIATSVIEAFLESDNPTEARRYSDRAFLLNPSNTVITLTAARTSLRDGDTSRAKKIAKLHREARDNDLLSFRTANAILREVGDTPSLIFQYNEAIKHFPNEPAFRIRAGKLLLDDGDWVAGEETFDALAEWVDTAPVDASLKAGLYAQMAYELAVTNIGILKAREWIVRARAIDPDDPYFLGTLGIIHLRRGDYVLAQRYLSEAVARTGHSVFEEFLRRFDG